LLLYNYENAMVRDRLDTVINTTDRTILQREL